VEQDIILVGPDQAVDAIAPFLGDDVPNLFKISSLTARMSSAVLGSGKKILDQMSYADFRNEKESKAAPSALTAMEPLNSFTQSSMD